MGRREAVGLRAERVAIRVGSRSIAVIRQQVAVQRESRAAVTLPFSAAGGWLKVTTIPSLNCRLFDVVLGGKAGDAVRATALHFDHAGR